MQKKCERQHGNEVPLNRINYFCTNPNCEIKLSCGECHLDYHQNHVLLPLREFPKFAQQRVDWSRSLDNDKLTQQIQGLEKEIYKQIHNLCEKMIVSLKVAIDYTKLDVNNITEEILQELVQYAPEKILSQINTQINFLQQTIYNVKPLINLDNIAKDIPSNQLKLDTKILTYDMSFFTDIVLTRINQLQPIYKLDLVYRGSQDGFTFEDFSCRTSQIKQSIILIKSDQNQIIGGYLPYEFLINNKLNDQSYRSFIFSATKREIYLGSRENEVVISGYKRQGFFMFEFGKADIRFILPTKDNDGLQHTAHLYSEFPQSYSGHGLKHIPISSNKSDIKQYLLDKPNAVDYNNRSKIIELEVFKVISY